MRPEARPCIPRVPFSTEIVRESRDGRKARGYDGCMRRSWLAPFINLGHFVDHLAMLVFPTVVIALAREWDRSYSELLPLTIGGFIAFGAFALPAGGAAGHRRRYKMRPVVFLRIRPSPIPT